MDVVELATEDDVLDALARFAAMLQAKRQTEFEDRMKDLLRHAVVAPGDGADSQHLFLLAQLILWLLLLVPVIIAIYVLLLRRRRKGAFRYPNLALVQ